MTTLHPSPDIAAALRADLIDAGYTAAAVRGAWGELADNAIGQGLCGPALVALGDRADALAVLARVLFLGADAASDALDAALPRTRTAGLVALGLATVSGERVHPTALLRPQAFDDAAGSGDWLIASDLDEAALHGALPTGHVLGVGGASLTLAGLQLDAPVGRVLDLGAGCGIQALRAARAADVVVATDISERALAFTRLNALLNQAPGILTRGGSLFDPVTGGAMPELFDRVVSNPPFVITPRAAGVPEYEYRDAGMAGDDLVAAVITGVGAVLAPGGTAQLLGNWEYRRGADGLERVKGWVATSPVPLDAWVVEREQLDPLAYAQLWVRDGGTASGSPEYERLIEAWLADFAARGVVAVGFGYVLLRRPANGAVTLSRYERLTQALPGALGSHIGAALAAHDGQAMLSDGELAEAVLRVASDVTEARHYVPGAEDPQVIELRQGGGYARTYDVDPALAALVGACDGDLAVGVLIDAIAQLLEVDETALRADLLPRVRELIFAGILIFGGSGTPDRLDTW